MPLYYTVTMPYSHESAHHIIPNQFTINDVEPTLEMNDPNNEEALNHFMAEHPDIYSMSERIASELSGGDSLMKIRVLKAIARTIIYIEQR
jgi:hypothetical protein